MRGETTVVRVYASLASPVGGNLAAVPAWLYGTRHGKQLPGSPLSPLEGVRTLSYSAAPWTTCADRADPQGAYSFVLPETWTAGDIELRARVVPEQVIFGAGGECGSSSCLANNELRLVDVAFEDMSYVTVTPVRLNSGIGEPKAVLKRFFDLLPGDAYYVAAGPESYAGTIEIASAVADPDLTNSERCTAVRELVEDWASQNTHGDMTVGVLASGNVCFGQSNGDAHLVRPGEASAFSVVDQTAPLKSVAHELFHGIGRAHADTACGGNSSGQRGQTWPPDQRGHIHGIGLDVQPGSGGASGSFRVLVPAGVLPAGTPTSPAQPNEWFDLMSYCAGESSAWLSTQGWGLRGWLSHTIPKEYGTRRRYDSAPRTHRSVSARRARATGQRPSQRRRRLDPAC